MLVSIKGGLYVGKQILYTAFETPPHFVYTERLALSFPA